MLRRLTASRTSTERTRYCGVSSHGSGTFNATFLPNSLDERQQSGQIKAVGCWFESGRCVVAFRGLVLLHTCRFIFIFSSHESLLTLIQVKITGDYLVTHQETSQTLMGTLWSEIPSYFYTTAIWSDHCDGGTGQRNCQNHSNQLLGFSVSSAP